MLEKEKEKRENQGNIRYVSHSKRSRSDFAVAAN